MLLRPLLPLGALILLGCSSPEDVAEATGVERGAATAGAKAGTAGAATAVLEETDTYIYELSYPATVGAVPALARHIEQSAARAKAEMIAEARAGRADARENGYPFNPHSLSEEWELVADIPGWLSLSNSFATYTGGAHGMYGLKGLVWDEKNARAMAPVALFESPVSLGAAIGAGLCEALNAARIEKGVKPLEVEDGTFAACPGLDEATVLVGSSNGRTFDRITVWFGPYVAGSYAEGAYELDFDMTAAMLETVKPAYRSAFSAMK